jgi:hypothetical protein
MNGDGEGDLGGGDMSSDSSSFVNISMPDVSTQKTKTMRG